MAPRDETLTKEVFDDLVRDAGGGREFAYALWQKIETTHRDVLNLADRVDEIEKTVYSEDETDETTYQLARLAAAEEQREQMLGDLSASYPWHLLHRDCWSWPLVRALREKIIEDCVEARVFNARPELAEQSVISAIHRNTAFKPYREWVWKQTGGTNAEGRMVAGLDPWSYIEGLKILASASEDPDAKNTFIEIHMSGGSR